MIRKKGGRYNTDGTAHFREKTKNDSRKQKMRKTLQSTKSTRAINNLYHLVVLPEKPMYYIENIEDPDEEQEIFDWWAMNIVEMLSEVSNMYHTLADVNESWLDLLSTARIDKTRGYPDNVTYRWKKSHDTEPEVLVVNEYIQLVLDWADGQIANENIFPTDEENDFPRNFKAHVAKMFSRLFRIYHIVFVNETLFSKMGNDSSFDISFRHFLFFGWKWELLRDSDTSMMQFKVPTLREKFLRDQEAYIGKQLPKH